LSLMQTSPEMRQDGLAVSDTRNKANRGNREVTYNAYIAFSALFFVPQGGRWWKYATHQSTCAPAWTHLI
jgi:hypothetical protein